MAPAGQEASYASLAFVPLLLGKIFGSLAYQKIVPIVYPQEGPSNPGMLWTFIGGMVLVSPIALLALRGVLKVKEAERG
jgi:hypothetical protein